MKESLASQDNRLETWKQCVKKFKKTQPNRLNRMKKADGSRTL